MKVFEKKFKFIIFPIYYLIHNNFFFGILQKFVFKIFKYKKFKFELTNLNLPISYFSSFLWKTYELNDRVIIERNLSKRNKCIIIGGGIGFIGVITYHLTKKKIFVFEINKKVINLLKLNLKKNKTKFKIFNKNLTLSHNFKNNFYYDNDNFLINSLYRDTDKKIFFKNLFYKKIKKFEDFNTLIIDGEGIEKYYISNIYKLNNIKYLIFEFHSDIFDASEKKIMFRKLRKNNFVLKDEFINSFYFEKLE